MKASIGSSVVLSLLIAVMAQAQGTGDQVEDTPKKEKTVASFMDRKLELSKQALQGIVTEDFPLIKKSADGLEKMSREAEWDVFHMDEYNHFSAEFRRITRSMGNQAEK